MAYQNIFKRYELKYLISQQQKQLIIEKMQDYMKGDTYGKSTICNIYFDTPDFLLIRRSVEKPIYKEKLRLRSYGIATPDSNTFVELKKKYQSVVYKRRINMAEKDSMAFLCDRAPIVNSQIGKEIDYCFESYKNLQPKVVISYSREAFYSKTDSNFRITFDENILWRDYDLSLCKGIYGMPILKVNQVLMEIKTSTAIPLWMTAILSENYIYKTSFSKYGNAYSAILEQQKIGELTYA